jgi:hypothetical protein
VVATSVAVEGMYLTSGEDVLVADSPSAFADAIVRLYNDRELWEKLAAGGRENIRRYFSRDVARSAITRLIALADGHRAAKLGRTDKGAVSARKALSADSARRARRRCRIRRGPAFGRALRIWSAAAIAVAAQSPPQC